MMVATTAIADENELSFLAMTLLAALYFLPGVPSNFFSMSAQQSM
jgi:hypothetical protein